MSEKEVRAAVEALAVEKARSILQVQSRTMKHWCGINVFFVQLFQPQGAWLWV